MESIATILSRLGPQRKGPLDTNVVVAAFNGDQALVERLNSVSPGQAVLPAMALAELRYGASSS